MVDLFDTAEQEKSIQKINNFSFSLLKQDERKLLKLLITGRAKTGKTRLCLTAEEPILFLDTEFGAGLLAEQFKDKKIYYQDITKINEEGQIDSIKSLDFLEECLMHARLLKPKTIIIDSMTSIWQWLQDWLRYEVVDKKGESYKSGVSTLNKFTEVPTDRRDWGKANHRHHSLIMNLLSLNCNIILTAQNHPTYDAQGNQLSIDKPAIQKNTPFLIDEVLELKREYKNGKVIFKAIIQDSRHNGKELIGKEIEEPSFDKIKEIIFK